MPKCNFIAVPPYRNENSNKVVERSKECRYVYCGMVLIWQGVLTWSKLQQPYNSTNRISIAIQMYSQWSGQVSSTWGLELVRENFE